MNNNWQAVDMGSPKPFIPSQSGLLAQIDRAMAAFDAAADQARRRKDAAEDDRVARAWAAEAEAKRRKRIWGSA